MTTTQVVELARKQAARMGDYSEGRLLGIVAEGIVPDGSKLLVADYGKGNVQTAYLIGTDIVTKDARGTITKRTTADRQLALAAYAATQAHEWDRDGRAAAKALGLR